MLVIISSVSVPICNHFHVRRANSCKITPFKEECPYFSPSFLGTPLPSSMKFCHEILEALCYHMVKTRIFISPGYGTVPGRDGHQDRRTELP